MVLKLMLMSAVPQTSLDEQTGGSSIIAGRIPSKGGGIGDESSGQHEPLYIVLGKVG